MLIIFHVSVVKQKLFTCEFDSRDTNVCVSVLDRIQIGNSSEGDV